MAKNLKGYRYYCKYLKGYGMLGLILRNMRIQCFLNFGDICHISLKGYGILGPPPYRASKMYKQEAAAPSRAHQH